MQVLTLDDIRERCRMCGDCWECITAAKTEHHRRYVQVKHAGKHILARRLAYQLNRGVTVRGDLNIVPDCGNPYCINPAHQKALTESQKARRAASRGAFNSPVRAAKIAATRRRTNAKLTSQQAAEIRISDEPGPVLSARYGINNSLVNRIKRGDAWRDYASPFLALGARA